MRWPFSNGETGDAPSWTWRMLGMPHRARYIVPLRRNHGAQAAAVRRPGVVADPAESFEAAAEAARDRRREPRVRVVAAGERDLVARGLDDAHAWLPPPIAKRFGRRLAALGWIRDDAWTPYCRRLRRSG